MVSRMFYDFRAAIPTGCDICHFFNCVNHSSKTPWVISVESGVPWSMPVIRCVENKEPDFSVIANDQYVIDRIKNLASPNCLGLLALSKCTEHIEIEIIQQFPLYEEIIKKKLVTLHPPQELIIKDISEKGLTWEKDEVFTFLFVGNDFYRKGGREILSVLAEMHEKHHFKLILISSMRIDEKRYILTEQDEEDAHKIIQENSDWIDFYPGLPNCEVLEKMKHSHVCLLPTWMDTYAYSVLESQACGTPLITTSLRALTEINNSEVGWLIDVPVNRLNNPLHNTISQRNTFQKMLIDGLKDKIEYVLTHRDEVRQKSHSCLERIDREHNPKTYADKLEIVYDGRIAELTTK